MRKVIGQCFVIFQAFAEGERIAVEHNLVAGPRIHWSDPEPVVTNGVDDVVDHSSIRCDHCKSLIALASDPSECPRVPVVVGADELIGDFVWVVQHRLDQFSHSKCQKERCEEGERATQCRKAVRETAEQQRQRDEQPADETIVVGNRPDQDRQNEQDRDCERTDNPPMFVRIRLDRAPLHWPTFSA